MFSPRPRLTCRHGNDRVAATLHQDDRTGSTPFRRCCQKTACGRAMCSGRLQLVCSSGHRTLTRYIASSARSAAALCDIQWWSTPCQECDAAKDEQGQRERNEQAEQLIYLTTKAGGTDIWKIKTRPLHAAFVLAALVYNIHHTRHLHRGALEDATAAADAAWLHLVLVTKQPSDAAKEIKRRLSVAARLWVFRVLMVASLMAFECDHDGTNFWGGGSCFR